MSKKHVQRKISLISAVHYFKLVFRSALLLAALVLYLTTRKETGGFWFEKVQNYPFLLIFIWVVFAVDMISRCFPSGLESMGCQKQFVRNYVPVPDQGPGLCSVLESNGCYCVGLVCTERAHWSVIFYQCH